MSDKDRDIATVSGASALFNKLPGEKMFLWANLFFVCAMMLSHRLANLGVVLLSIVFVLNFRYTRFSRASLPFLILSLLLFSALLAVNCFIYPGEFGAGFSKTEKYIAIGLIPLLLSRVYPGGIGRSEWQRVLWVYACFVTLLAMYCFALGLYKFVFLPAPLEGQGDYYNGVSSRWNYLSYATLSQYVDLHPTYLSVFVSFAIFIFIDNYNEWRRFRYSIIAAIVFLVVILFLLSSRTATAAFFVAGAVYAFMKGRNNSRLLITRYLPVGLFVIVAFGAVFYFSPLLRKRVTDFTALRTDVDVRSWNAVNLRLAIWNCNYTIARNNLFRGIGFEQEIRNACYAQYSFYPYYGTGLNAHNQYLEFLVAGGIGLCLLFLVYIGYLVWVAIKHKEKLFLTLLILLLVNFLTECMLGRVKGDLFITYFASFFMYQVFNVHSRKARTEEAT